MILKPAPEMPELAQWARKGSSILNRQSIINKHSLKRKYCVSFINKCA